MASDRQSKGKILLIDLDTVLRMAEEQNSQVALAREKLNESQAEKDRIKELTPQVAMWLETSATPALRVNWLWTVQAKLGDPKNLITGLTRDWVMLRLEEHTLAVMKWCL